MGTLTALSIYSGAAELLEDIRYVTYLETSFVKWINEAQRAVVLVRPDANTVIASIQLVDGALQQLGDTVNRLGGLLMNTGVDGTVPGKAIRGPVPQETLDSLSPDWMTETGDYVREYTYDEAFPNYFHVRPSVVGTWYLRAKLFNAPTDIAAGTDLISLPDSYSPAITEWLLYRTFGRDSERTPNFGRAARHYSSFFQMLGVKLRSDLAVSPRNLEYGKAPA